MTADEKLYALLAEPARQAGRSAYSVVKAYGFDLDDCSQEGTQALLVLMRDKRLQPLAYEDQLKYLKVIARRSTIRAARGRVSRPALAPLPKAADGSEADVPDTSEPAAVVVDLVDLVASADGDTAHYLRLRVFDGLTWDEMQTVTGWSRDRLGAAKATAALWLLNQYEGRATR